MNAPKGLTYLDPKFTNKTFYLGRPFQSSVEITLTL